MPGRWDPDEFPDHYDSADVANGANGLGRQRPRSHRAERRAWEREEQERSFEFEEERRPWRRRRWSWLLFAGLVLLCGVCTFMGGFAAVSLGIGLGTSKDAAATASDFLSALGTRDYAQAYKYLGPPTTLQPGAQENFIAQAQRYDACFGTVTNYKQVEGSTILQDNTWSSTYAITRSKLPRSYRLTLTLQQDSHQQWRIIDYKSEGVDNALAPADASCS
jgi:hypothetical protein